MSVEDLISPKPDINQKKENAEEKNVIYFEELKYVPCKEKPAESKSDNKPK